MEKSLKMLLKVRESVDEKFNELFDHAEKCEKRLDLDSEWKSLYDRCPSSASVDIRTFIKLWNSYAETAALFDGLLDIELGLEEENEEDKNVTGFYEELDKLKRGLDDMQKIADEALSIKVPEFEESDEDVYI